MPRRTTILALARSIDPLRAEAYAGRLSGALPPGSEASEIGILLAAAYPALGPAIEAAPGLVKTIAAEGYHAPRSRAEQLSRLRARLPDLSDTTAVMRELRVTAKRERMRIALREARSRLFRKRNLANRLFLLNATRLLSVGAIPLAPLARVR